MENEIRLENPGRAAKRTAGDGYRPAKQSRSAKTEQRFLEAAETLFAAKGYKGTRVADIIQLSGCSTGSFYHRFSDKEGLFRIMMQHYLERTYRYLAELHFAQAKHGDLRSMMTFFANSVLGWIVSNKGFNRASQELASDHQDVMRELYKITHAIGDILAPLAADYQDEITAEKPAEAMRYAAQNVIMIALQTQMGNGPMFPTDKDELTKVIVDGALGILRPSHGGN